MRILILTAWYSPFIHPRAHRWTALAEHWAEQGHQVTVLSTRRRDCENTETRAGVRVVRSGFDSLKEMAYFLFRTKQARGRPDVGKPQRAGVLQQIAFFLYRNTWKKVIFPDEAMVWHWPAKKALKKMLLDEKYDVLISVSLPFSGHLIALKTLEKLSQDQRPRWVTDMGDPFALQHLALNNRFFYGRWNLQVEREVLVRADASIVTTKQTKSRFEQHYGAAAVAKMKVIGPLLHPMPSFRPAAMREDQKIILAYFGALYRGMRTPDAFAELARRLLEHSPDMKDRLEIRFYGEIFPEFYDLLCKVPNLRMMGLQSRETVQAAMKEADVLLNIGNLDNCQLPSKAVDYLAAAKPIVHLSYVDNDPFVSFFSDFKDVLLEIPVSQEGRVSDEQIQTFLKWLKKTPIVGQEPQWVLTLTGYSVESIAAQYWSLMTEATPD